MKKAKPLLKHKEAHSSKAKIGMGDNYGTGVKQKVGKIVDNYEAPKLSSKNIGKPPKSLA